MTDEPMAEESSEHQPVPEPEAERLAEILEVTLGEDFAGHPVRVDAGERGRVWVALAGAAEDRDARRVTTRRLDERLADMNLTERGIAYRISSSPSEGDLLLVCEFFTEE